MSFLHTSAALALIQAVLLCRTEANFVRPHVMLRTTRLTCQLRQVFLVDVAFICCWLTTASSYWGAMFIFKRRSDMTRIFSMTNRLLIDTSDQCVQAKVGATIVGIKQRVQMRRIMCPDAIQVQAKGNMSSSYDVMSSPDVVTVLGPRWEPCVVSLAHCLRKMGKTQQAAQVNMEWLEINYGTHWSSLGRAAFYVFIVRFQSRILFNSWW